MVYPVLIIAVLFILILSKQWLRSFPQTISVLFINKAKEDTLQPRLILFIKTFAKVVHSAHNQANAPLCYSLDESLSPIITM